MASYGREAKSGFLWGVLGRATSTIAAIAGTVVLARMLTPHDFGVAATVTFFITVAQRISNLGFNTALIRVPELRRDHPATVFAVNVALGVIVGGLLALTAPWLGAFYRSPEAARAIPVAGLTFALGVLGTVPGALMARQLKFRQLVMIEAVYGWLVTLSSVVLAFFGLGYWSLVYSLLIGAAWDATVKLIMARWRPELWWSRAALRELLSFGAGLHLKRLLDSVALNIDNMVIGRTLGLTALGIYDKAFTSVNRAVTMVSYAGQTVSLSVLGKMQDDPERFRKAFRRITLGIGIASYPAFAGLAVVAKPLFLILFGPQWIEAVIPFQVLCVAGALKTYASYISSAVQAQGRVWGEVWRQALYVSLIVGGVTVGSIWGLPGASIGVLVATVVMTITMCDLLQKVSALSWADLIVPHFAALGCGAVVVASVMSERMLYSYVGRPLPVGSQLAIECGVGAVAAAIYLLTCPFKDVRVLVRETLFDFAPSVGRKLGLSPI